jgi:membrane protease YdiL (CAAX protease family)
MFYACMCLIMLQIIIKKRDSHFFSRINRVSFVLILFFTGVITATINFAFFYEVLLANQPREISGAKNIFVAIISYCILVPVLETLIFVVGPYKLAITSSFLRKNLVLVIIISSSVFAILHVTFTSSIHLFPHFFLTCFVWFFGYASRIKTDRHSFWLVVIAHGLYNFITVLGEYI